jgi:amino acid permease
MIFFIFVSDVNISNLYTFSSTNIFLPFGVVLFALMSFHAIPELEIILEGREHLMKKVIVISTLISIVAYLVFAFVVVGAKGVETPEVATLVLGKIFVILGIFTMFTSYLALGDALKQHFTFDGKLDRIRAWFYTAIIPVFIFVFTQLTDFFSFTTILSIGGVVSGGLTGILILLMVKSAKKKGNRKPEYSVRLNKPLIWILILVFVAGAVIEVVKYFL